MLDSPWYAELLDMQLSEIVMSEETDFRQNDLSYPLLIPLIDDTHQE